MANAVNEQDFRDPISVRLARGEAVGADQQIWLDPLGQNSVSPVSGGMIDPRRHNLESSTLLYRFASVVDGAEGAMKGGWWLGRAELDQLIRYADVNQKSLGYAVRLLCCVPPEWGSALNFLVGVRTAGVIAAWRGLANSASAAYKVPPKMSSAAAGTTVIKAQNDIAALRVPQLFIPGTRRDGATRALFNFVGQWQTEGALDWVYGSGV